MSFKHCIHCGENFGFSLFSFDLSLTQMPCCQNWPKSLHICTLLDKAERREAVIPIKYSGFVIPNKFVFGYGLDLDEYYRNLPFIGVVDLNRYQPPA